MIKPFIAGLLIGALSAHSVLTAPPKEEPSIPRAPDTETQRHEPLPHYEKVVPPQEPDFEPILEPELLPEPIPEGAVCTTDCPLIEVRGEVEQYFADVPVLAEIARCESEYRHWDVDGSVLKNKQGSSATGVMQIMASVHEKTANVLGYDLEDLHGNMAYARHLYEEQGTTPWNASIYCWSGLARL